MEAMVVLLLPNLSAYQREESVVVAPVSYSLAALNMLSPVVDGVAPYG
jgi:hypothetical protein